MLLFLYDSISDTIEEIVRLSPEYKGEERKSNIIEIFNNKFILYPWNKGITGGRIVNNNKSGDKSGL